MSQQPQATQAASKLLAHLQTTNELAKRLEKYSQQQTQQQTECAQLADEATAALSSAGAVSEANREKVAAALRDPKAALELLRDYALQQAEEKQASIGEVVPSGSPQAQPRRRGPVGSQIFDHDATPEGRAFRDKIMNPIG